MKSILFVCTGNICRSPMAEVLLRHMLEKEGIKGIELFSRGLSATDGRPMSAEALDVLAAQGVQGSDHRARRLTVEDVDRADLILVMERAHMEYLSREFPKAAHKTFMLKEYGGDSGDIDDPYGQSREVYEKCKMEIQDSLLSVLSKLKHLGR